MSALSYDDVKAAAERIDGVTRPVPVIPVQLGPVASAEIYLALDFMQHSGSFKDRGAANFAAAHLADGAMPAAGVVIASGGNAGLACAWAAARHGVPATVFVPRTAPRVKVARLRALGAEVRQVGTEYAQAQEAARLFSAETGALASHAYDDPYVVAGAGTLLPEIRACVPGLDTVILSVGGGGLFAGTAIAAERHGLRVVAVEPERCRALNAAIEAGEVVDVEVDSVAADSLGARRASQTALYWARRADTVSVLVGEDQILTARQQLWENHRLVVEHAAATALAALTSGAYRPIPGERIAVVLCGANTDPATLG
ncbi:serine/threonine dehydratase [Kitasatospora sp. GAS204B]|uniref:serine/threonine dehydratase n=1 Tax=unclassified Kitasatospora TaxID=2633591 RepID=UPI002474BE17|nr:serine/threonine dehydratase [Kitasatospora sp. GAS204B]MDH6118414.1 threonine dehydratase [Kitasatospora sp. GAS204B]